MTTRLLASCLILPIFLGLDACSSVHATAPTNNPTQGDLNSPKGSDRQLESGQSPGSATKVDPANRS